MKNFLLKLFFISALILFAAALFAQEGGYKKYALVIGNSNYTGLTPLANPVNDANDITAVLEHLGFNVEKVLNGNLEQMEDAAMRLKDKLSAAENAYGFFFYAGHGVQSGGENYLIPVNANIPSENALRNRAMSVQMVLDDLNDARNGLNVVVLDACRDNPFGWSRSSTRGLAIVSRQPSDSIIVYSTSAGQRASDGDGRNGLFTSQLISNLATPGLEVSEIFRRTGEDVAKVSKNNQVPAVYSQFFGRAFLGETPVDFEGNIRQPGATVIINSGRTREPEQTKYWSVGASVGSSFGAPWLIGTVHGTIAPLKYSFIEVGFDFGFINRESYVDKYYSMHPFVHFAFFWPFTSKIGVYAGAGAGLWLVSYKFVGLENKPEPFFVASITTGAMILDMINVSYSLRTNFKGSNHKVSVGYTYRFK